MATYQNYQCAITSASTTSDWGTTSTQYYTFLNNGVVMSREDMTFNKRGKKNNQAKKKENFKSELMNWVINNLGLDSSDIAMIFHSPMYTQRNSMMLSDFDKLKALGYNAHTIPSSSHIVYDPYKGQKLFGRIFVDGALEHMPGVMAQALFLKNLMYKLHRERSSYLILSTKTREQIREEAEHNNYPEDGKGYLITLPDGNQSRIEGIDDKEIKTLIAYGRIGSIWKTDTLSKVKGSHIILQNGV